MHKKEFKIMFLGYPGIGAKTSLINYIITHSFNENSEATRDFVYSPKSINTPLGEITLNLWDSSGQIPYHSLIKIFLKILIVLLLDSIL